jgi:hypothetical protein
MASFVVLNGRSYPTEPARPDQASPMEMLLDVGSRLAYLKFQADEENDGPGSTEWEDVDLIHELAGEVRAWGNEAQGDDGPQDTVFVSEDGEFAGTRLDFAQLVRLATAVDELIQAYENGADNGGSMDWNDVDAAQNTALDGLPQSIKDVLKKRARQANGCENDEGEAQDSAGGVSDVYKAPRG